MPEWMPILSAKAWTAVLVFNSVSVLVGLAGLKNSPAQSFASLSCGESFPALFESSRIVFRAIRRIVRDADFQTQLSLRLRFANRSYAGLVIPASLELMLGLLRIDNHAIQKLDEIPLGLETDS